MVSNDDLKSSRRIKAPFGSWIGSRRPGVGESFWRGGRICSREKPFRKSGCNRRKDGIDHVAAKESHGHLVCLSIRMDFELRPLGPVQGKMAGPDIIHFSDPKSDDPILGLCGHPADVRVIAIGERPRPWGAAQLAFYLFVTCAL